MESDEVKKMRDLEALRHIIAQWNSNRLDLFSLSEPNEDLEFHGVMRFYFQDSGQKIATKCIRVSSTASTTDVIETLIEKFRPDMKMLYVPEYALYEIHPNGEERRLGPDEKPLLVQLNWHKDDREGRFLLRKVDEKSTLSPALPEDSSFKRKLSKREKKAAKKQEKLRKLKEGENDENETSVAEKLYTELPETSFTRSISNPEAVMRRRRQQKLEKKLQQYRSKDGGPDSGGTLKIYGESLSKDVPYKTLLLSVRDNAAFVVKEMLEKYGIFKEDPSNYCLVKVISGPHDNNNSGSWNQEVVLEDDECPLSILMHHMQSTGTITFHIKRKTVDLSRRRKKKQLSGSLSGRLEETADRLPFLLELNPDGSEMRNNQPKKYRLQMDVTEVGSERCLGGDSLQLYGPAVLPRHCVIAHTEGIVTVTPCSRDAETHVNGQRIFETTILQHGSLLRFGRVHTYRYMEPVQETSSRYGSESTLNERPVSSGAGNFETTFDVDGHVETVSTSSLNRQEDNRSQMSGGSAGQRVPSGMESYPKPPGQDPILPAVLELREETEDAFLYALITDLDVNVTQFKLASTYALYLVARYRASTHFRPDLTPIERAQKLTHTLSRVGAMIQAVIQERYSDIHSQAFWMANASELLHFLKTDRHISAFSLDAQDLLAEAVEASFRNLISYIQSELTSAMPAMLVDREEGPDDEAPTNQLLSVLSSCMGLLRRCRVNAALTIQLFSHLFHFINMWLFNRLVGADIRGTPANAPLCSRHWGQLLLRRLKRLSLWAERQGLELAAECHMARISHAAHLLQAPKNTPEDLATVCADCFRLNSLQLRALLRRYQPAPNEPRIPTDIIETVAKVAESTVDEVARADGRAIRLDEDPHLPVQFLLPDDGYSCDVVRGVPSGLVDCLGPLQQGGLCRLTPQPTAIGIWTIYLGEPQQQVAAQPMLNQQTAARSPSVQSVQSGGTDSQKQVPAGQLETISIQLRKVNESMGLSIVAARGQGQDRLGIYIKSVVKGGSADVDGRLQAGDQLLSVDGQSLCGITQDRAAEIMMRTGAVVSLEVAKQGAVYHGLATLLSQPSPTATMASLRKNRPRSEEVLNDSLRYDERLVDWDKPPRQPGNLNAPLGRLSPDQSAFVHGPRRMSERDLSSKASRTYPEPPHIPRGIQNSKSVPALNSDIPPGPPRQPLAEQNRNQQLYVNDQRMASTLQTGPSPVLPHPARQFPQPPQMRSRSVQNLTEPGSHIHQSKQVSYRERMPSTSVLNTTQEEEEREYQNVNFQNKLKTVLPPHQSIPPPEVRGYAQGHRQQPVDQYTHRLQPPQQIQQRPHAALPANYPYSAQAGVLPARGPPAQHASYPQELLRTSHVGPSKAIPNQPFHGNGVSSQGTSVPNQGHIDHAQNQPSYQHHMHVPHNQPYQQSMLQSPQQPPHAQPPPLVPKHAVAQQPQYSNFPGNYSVHRNEYPQQQELLQMNQAQKRYQQREEITRQFDETVVKEIRQATQRTTSGSNPWRDTKEDMEERDRLRQKLTVRHWRDQKVSELELLGPEGRNSKQEEQLKALILEREFQKRVEEMAMAEQREDESEEEEEVPPLPPVEPPQEDNSGGLLRLVQEDLERAKQWRQERQQNNASEGKQKKLDEYQRRQKELEAAQLAEERILKEAQRRREEEIRMQQQLQQQALQHSQIYGSQRGQHLVPHSAVNGIDHHRPPPPPSSLPPSSPTVPRSDNQMTADEKLMNANYPTRSALAGSRNETSKKNVSFNENSILYDTNANQAKINEEEIAFISEAENIVNPLMISTGSTPGVIGTQEVYRDPRQRRLAEKELERQSKQPLPDKLSFKDKMKLFALETGENTTPKDKVKISKAQREIESERQGESVA
ncbi:afadin-like isoform X2 [Artemia franciscana]|uniref:Afadin n=1 Tax=Artemia franciscana TaxID=6661 RepID=A0AA88HRP3_ARTSF|nr:hypothetical protein QYM36_010423 [Artemia franciscana]KAK2715851.1 hypothetical protein QYM36_010423 [Artemia franciscana]KAK2715853.1 hypothetical protein QYM36_010423 [Artemia franciscana]